jgi:hypothetical protein
MGLEILEKRAGENQYVGFDFSSRLGTGEQIVSANVTCSNGLNSTGLPVLSANNTQVSQLIYAGTVGYYGVTFSVVTNAGNTKIHTYIIRLVTDTLPSAANANISLVRLDEAKGFIRKTTDEDTAIIDQLIDSVSGQFNAYWDGTIASTNYANEAYDGNGKQVMYLRNYPVTGNMTISENDVALTAGNDNDYLCYNSTGRLYRVNRVWYAGPKTVLVTYTAGYNCTTGNITLPSDIRLAALKQIAFEFGRYSRGDLGLDSVTYPDGSIARTQSGLLAEVKEVLDRYRRYTL